MDKSPSSFFHWPIIGIAFLAPLFFLPSVVNGTEIHKQTLFILLAGLAAVVWLVQAIRENRLVLRAHWAFVLLVGVLITTALSSVLSLAPAVSWIGQNGQEYTSFFTLLACAFLFSAGVHALTTDRLRSIVSFAIIASGTVLGLVGLFNAASTSFGVLINPVGTPNAFGLTLLLLALFGLGTWLLQGEGKAFPLLAGVGVVITTSSALLTLLILDATSLWLVGIIGSSVLLAVGFWRAHAFSRVAVFLLPMLLFICSLVFLFAPGFLPSPYPAEVALSTGASWKVIQGSWKDGSIVLGTGPGTFAVEYLRHQPSEVVKTSFWDTRFDRGSSGFFTSLATFGVLGTVLLMVFGISLLVLGGRIFFSKHEKDWRAVGPYLFGFLFVAVGWFFYPSNMTLTALGWLFATLLASAVLPESRTLAFARSPRAALGSAFTLMLFGAGIFALGVVTVIRYSAEMAFARAVTVSRDAEQVDETIRLLDRAARLNRWDDGYYRNLAAALLAKVQLLAASDEEPDAEELQNYIGATVNAAARAVELGPANAENWQIASDVYREISGAVPQAEDFAITSAEKAVELAPQNPKFLVLLARAYMARAMVLEKTISDEDGEAAEQVATERADALLAAEQALNNALLLKGDFVSAQYYLAFVKEAQGNLADAVKNMESVRQQNSGSTEIGMQLALLYLRQGKNALAEEELERVLTLNENHSNALWYLSVIYEKDGRMSDAIAAVQKVAELNPGNTLVNERLDSLLTATADPETLPSSEELPEPVESGGADADTTSSP